MKEIKILSSSLSIAIIVGLMWLTFAKDFPPVYSF